MILIAALALSDFTRYRVAETQGHWWFERPDGTPFFSSGVCCVNQGATAKTFKLENPGYAAYRSYASPEEWARETCQRLNDWGFNTVGAWSDDLLLRKSIVPDTYFMPTLSMGASAGAPWRDLWDPKVVGEMDSAARKGILAHRGDVFTVGYFSDNELGWWNGAMFEWGLKAGAASRTRLVALLRKRYATNWAHLLRDFDPEGASSFEALQKKGRLFLRPGGNGMVAVHEWMSVVSSRYYSLCRSIIKKYDPQALYLGDRYISNFYPEVAKSAGKYCDVVSTNLNADWNDGTFAKFFLPNLHRIAGKPLMITEYYASAMENRSGNKNDSSGFPVVQTQTERVEVFKRSSRIFLDTPYVVGAHWFQYYDEPKNGREDGENYNMGLVDTQDRPYGGLVKASRELFTSPNRTAPSAAKFSGAPVVDSSIATQLVRWPREKAFVPPTGACERGDLYISQDKSSLYFAIYWNEDRFGEAFYRGGHVPPSERARFEIRLSGQPKPVVARLGDEGPPKVEGAKVIAYATGVRNTAILQVRKPSTSVKITAIMDTRGRAYRMRWAIPFQPLQ